MHVGVASQVGFFAAGARFVAVALVFVFAACGAESSQQKVTCGNGQIDASETCDNGAGSPALCPHADCDDGNPCTIDAVVSGSANSCDIVCNHELIVACTDADGCCPQACGPVQDSDCISVCGDGIITASETCDDGVGSPVPCPSADCDDDDACTVDSVVWGDVATCDIVCDNQAVETCTGGDGCCPQANCGPGDDSDCASICGDGLVTTGETCDDGVDSPTPCPAVDCDDDSSCTIDTVASGSVAQCDIVCRHDDVVTCMSGDGCCPGACGVGNDTDCPSVCGDGLVTAGETCDDKVGSPAVCPPSDCNDGVSCTTDAVVSGSVAACDIVCSHDDVVACTADDNCCPSACGPGDDPDCPSICGDGLVSFGETCDWGAGSSTQCPTPDCDDSVACTVDTVVSGSIFSCDIICEHEEIETCGNDDNCCPADCGPANDRDCLSVCGDGLITAGETCDGGVGSPVLCPPADCDDVDACTIDSVVWGSPEGCDIVCGRQSIAACVSDDGCCPNACGPDNDDDCPSVCGDGLVTHGETCDDGAGSAASCPAADCDDFLPCTEDVFAGGAVENCDIVCFNYDRSICSTGDGCCPDNCDVSNDGDCLGAVCGDGYVSAPETCDNELAYSTCPTGCDDHDGCTVDTVIGAFEDCDVVCSHEVTITGCVDDDGCCPDTCDASNDNDCGCVIASIEYPRYATNPTNNCEICWPAQSRTDWTVLAPVFRVAAGNTVSCDTATDSYGCIDIQGTLTVNGGCQLDATLVHVSGLVNADYTGYAANAGLGTGARCSSGGGGGYGGLGGFACCCHAGEPRGPIYDFTAARGVEMGSGGVSAGSAGGKGGGRVEILADLAIVNGTLRANGAAGTNGTWAGGGGSGGGLLLDVSEYLAMSDTAMLSAKGGNGGSGTWGAGGGAGGRIKLFYPAGEMGAATVDVSGGARGTGTWNGYAGSAGTFYDSQRSPLLSSLTPAAAYFGDTIGLAGTGFGVTGGEVRFHGVGGGVVDWTDTLIEANVPTNILEWETIVVDDNGLASNGLPLGILNPVITDVSRVGPSPDPYCILGFCFQEEVRITGEGFGPEQGLSQVTLEGGAHPTITSWSDTEIRFLVPCLEAMWPEWLQVTVNGVSTSGYAASFVPPFLMDTWPQTGPVGTEVNVSIMAEQWIPNAVETVEVTFNDMPATDVTVSNGTILAVVPDGGSGEVKLILDGCQAYSDPYMCTFTIE